MVFALVKALPTAFIATWNEKANYCQKMKTRDFENLGSLLRGDSPNLHFAILANHESTAATATWNWAAAAKRCKNYITATSVTWCTWLWSKSCASTAGICAQYVPVCDFQPIYNTLLMQISFDFQGYTSDVFQDALVYAEHAGRQDIDLADVQLAVQGRVSHSFTAPPPREVRCTHFREFTTHILNNCYSFSWSLRKKRIRFRCLSFQRNTAFGCHMKSIALQLSISK